MKNIFLAVCALCLLLVGTASAQVAVTSPVNLDLGFGGGVSVPVGKLSDGDNTGFHVGAKGRISGFMPLHVVGFGNYNRLANKVGSESDVVWMLGAGLEYPIPSAVVKPYIGVDAVANFFSNTASGSPTRKRVGAGAGAGVSFSVPAMGSIDVSVKYHLLNLIGKKDPEDTISQIAGSVMLMFSVL